MRCLAEWVNVDVEEVSSRDGRMRFEPSEVASVAAAHDEGGGHRPVRGGRVATQHQQRLPEQANGSGYLASGPLLISLSSSNGGKNVFPIQRLNFYGADSFAFNTSTYRHGENEPQAIHHSTYMNSIQRRCPQGISSCFVDKIKVLRILHFEHKREYEDEAFNGSINPYTRISNTVLPTPTSEETTISLPSHHLHQVSNHPPYSQANQQPTNLQVDPIHMPTQHWTSQHCNLSRNILRPSNFLQRRRSQRPLNELLNFQSLLSQRCGYPARINAVDSALWRDGDDFVLQSRGETVHQGGLCCCVWIEDGE